MCLHKVYASAMPALILSLGSFVFQQLMLYSDNRVRSRPSRSRHTDVLPNTRPAFRHFFDAVTPTLGECVDQRVCDVQWLSLLGLLLGFGLQLGIARSPGAACGTGIAVTLLRPLLAHARLAQCDPAVGE